MSYLVLSIGNANANLSFILWFVKRPVIPLIETRAVAIRKTERRGVGVDRRPSFQIRRRLHNIFCTRNSIHFKSKMAINRFGSFGDVRSWIGKNRQLSRRAVRHPGIIGNLHGIGSCIAGF